MEVPESVLSLIKLREGFEAHSYPDSRGILTGGIGHRLSASEGRLYPKGAAIPEDVIQQWFLSDTTKAYQSALAQAEEIGCDNPILANALTSVIYQMGSAWNLPVSQGGKGFVHTWSLLLQHKWSDAANAVLASDWNKQTPVRCQDFRKALLSLT